MSLLPVYRDSFFTSLRRSDGMRLHMHYRKGRVYTDFSLSTAFEGYEGVVHGGMLFGILDAMMWFTIFLETGKIGMTRTVNMDFLKPVSCDVRYSAEARLLSVEGRDIWAEARIDNGGNELCAQVKGLFREAQGIDRVELLRNFDFTGISDEIRDVFMSKAG
jgi:uncharacterized protein (TIGR00369 family)